MRFNSAFKGLTNDVVHTWKLQKVAPKYSARYSSSCNKSVLQNMWACNARFTGATENVFPHVYTAAFPSSGELKMSSAKCTFLT